MALPRPCIDDARLTGPEAALGGLAKGEGLPLVQDNHGGGHHPKMPLTGHRAVEA